MTPLELSPATFSTAGVLLLALVAVESGGLYMYAAIRKRVALTPFQIGFARAGHAHAGVLVILSLVIQLYVDALTLDGIIATVARSGVPLAAILMPAGFFLSSSGAGKTAPNRLVWLVFAGAASLALGVTTLGVALLLA